MLTSAKVRRLCGESTSRGHDAQESRWAIRASKGAQEAREVYAPLQVTGLSPFVRRELRSLPTWMRHERVVRSPCQRSHHLLLWSRHDEGLFEDVSACCAHLDVGGARDAQSFQRLHHLPRGAAGLEALRREESGLAGGPAGLHPRLPRLLPPAAGKQW